MVKKLTYRFSGVDIKKGENFTSNVKKLFPRIREQRMLAFGSLFSLEGFLKEFKEPVLVSSCDGVGTKLKIAQSLNIHTTVGIDLVAMNVNDIVCLGAKPLFFLDYIACGRINIKVLKGVMKGIKKGLDEADCLLIGGETAQMPGMYSRDEYDLAGFCVGIVEGRRIIDGGKIKKGNVVIGLESNGLHSNGFSLVRRVFTKREIKKYAKELLRPTRLYVKPILSLLQSPITNHQSPIKGIAHITGGAFYNKATKILPSGLGMVIYKKNWPTPWIFKFIQQKGNIDAREMYSVFNMGIGMILVVERRYATKIIDKLRRDVKAYIIGEVVRARNKIRLV
jgi:phosphoribosylformylglycinamidine cyclo-ligase